MTLGELTRSIINDYAAITGNEAGIKSALTPESYLLFRNQAIKEGSAALQAAPLTCEVRPQAPEPKEAPAEIKKEPKKEVTYSRPQVVRTSIERDYEEEETESITSIMRSIPG